MWWSWMLTEYIVAITVCTYIKSCCTPKTNYMLYVHYISIRKKIHPLFFHFTSAPPQQIWKRRTIGKGGKTSIFFRIACPNCETHWVSSLLVWLHANELTMNLLRPVVGNSKCRPHTFDCLVSKSKAGLLTLSLNQTNGCPFMEVPALS